MQWSNLSRLVATCFVVASAQAQTAQVDVASLPIADVHFHYMAFMTPEDLRVRMDKNNIRWVISAGAQGIAGVAGNPAAGKNPWLRDSDLKAVLGDRFIAAVGGLETFQGERRDGTAFYTDAGNLWSAAAIERMNDLLKLEKRTFVEMFPNAESTSMEPMRRRRLPTNAPFFKEVMRLAIRHDVPVPMHMEWHPESVAQLEALLAEFPQGRVVLAHCGSITSAKDVRPLLERQSNVFCDLGFRGMPQLAHDKLRDQGRIIYWPQKTNVRADLYPDWRQLIEDFPDRFLLAIDDVLSWEQYDEIVAANRNGVLAKLSPETAEKVAYKNAVKVFRLPTLIGTATQ